MLEFYLMISDTAAMNRLRQERDATRVKI